MYFVLVAAALWAGSGALSHQFFILRLGGEKETVLNFLLSQPTLYSATS